MMKSYKNKQTIRENHFKMVRDMQAKEIAERQERIKQVLLKEQENQKEQRSYLRTKQ